MDEKKITLYGRIVLRMDVIAVTGLHIGGSAAGLEIGGVDSPVIRDPLTGRPYIPGSSIRGKMRSLIERVYGRDQNFPINNVRIHMLQPKPGENEQSFQQRFRENETCSIFGVTGDTPVPHPTALIVRDVYLSEKSATDLNKARTDLPYTEVKWEATIDRVTSAAVPRQIERVPAGAIFEQLELVYSLYGQSNLTHFPVLLEAIGRVEEDYLGGLGSRGSGKVRFELTEVFARKGRTYTRNPFALDESGAGVESKREAIIDWANQLFPDLPEA